MHMTSMGSKRKFRTSKSQSFCLYTLQRINIFGPRTSPRGPKVCFYFFKYLKWRWNRNLSTFLKIDRKRRTLFAANKLGSYISVRFLSDSHQIPIRFPSHSHQIPVRFPSDSHQIPVRFPSDSRQIPVLILFKDVLKCSFYHLVVLCQLFLNLKILKVGLSEKLMSVWKKNSDRENIF